MSTTTADGPTTTTADDDRIIGSGLLPHHVRELRDSGLSDDTILAARIHSESDGVKLARYLERKSWSAKLGSALVFPFGEADGNVTMRRVKPDNPQSDSRGKKRKYLQPSGVPTRPYFPPGVRSTADEPKRELFITEGEKKSLKSTQEGFPTIGLTGVDCWHSKKSTALHPELAAIKWHNRPVFIVFDSDAIDNVNVRNAECLLAAVLKTHGAIVKVVHIPAGPNGEKVGLDDYLVAHDRVDFRKLLDVAEEPELPDPGTLKENANAMLFEEEAAHMLATDQKDGLSRLRYWNDSFWRWKGGCYREIPTGDIRALVVTHLNRAFYRVSRTTTINVLDQLRAQCHLPASVKAPAWLAGGHDWDTGGLLATKNAIICLPKIYDGHNYRTKPTPALFNTYARVVQHQRPRLRFCRGKRLSQASTMGGVLVGTMARRSRGHRGFANVVRLLPRSRHEPAQGSNADRPEA